MAFKGVIKAGADIKVEFKSDYSNQGSGLLVAALGKQGGGTDAGSDQAAPGGQARVVLKKATAGRLRIDLDLADDSESGRLEVYRGTTLKTGEAVRGDVTWVYAVQ